MRKNKELKEERVLGCNIYASGYRVSTSTIYANVIYIEKHRQVNI